MRSNFCWSFEKGEFLPVLLMTPAVLLVFLVMIVPLCFGVFLSLCEFNFGSFDPGRDFVGLLNYANFFKDPTALRSVLNTLLFSAGAIAGDFAIGTLAAVLIHQLPRGLGVLVRPIITIPLLISPIVVGLIWRYIYDPQGVLYWLLGLFGLGLEHFPGVTAPSTALISTVIAHWWQVVPFVVIVLTAGLLLIPLELYEAAHIDGAGAFKAFWKITFPLLADVYMVILLISGVDTIKVFDIIFALTGGGPNNSTVSVSIFAFNQGFANSNLSYAMTIAVIAMLITFLVFGLPFVRRNRKRAAESV
jgi:multiple sugar transport system permease protein